MQDDRMRMMVLSELARDQRAILEQLIAPAEPIRAEARTAIADSRRIRAEIAARRARSIMPGRQDSAGNEALKPSSPQTGIGVSSFFSPPAR